MPPGAWPLVGRDEELAVARDVLTGESAGIVISGAPGVGKTRIAEELVARLVSSPGGPNPPPVVRLVATRAAATIPFGAAASLLGETAPAALPVDPEAVTATRQAVLERLGRTSRSASGNEPPVVSVDDAHLLDEASAQLVYHLAHTGAARLIVTVRSVEGAPETVEALWREGLCRRLELQPLSRDEVALLLRTALGGQVEQHSADDLWRVTAGNVLFLRELCRDGLERGLLVQLHGVWRWTTTPMLVGARLQELFDVRVGQLSGDVHDAAALLALGEPLPRKLLAQLVSSDAVAELDRRGLLDVTADPAVVDRGLDTPTAELMVRLSHPLYAEGLRGRLGPLETADLYARLADGVAARRHLTVDDRLRIAVWSVTSGRQVPARLLAEAGRSALDRGDPALAERLARAAPSEPAAALVLGEALAALRRDAEAEAVLAPLADVDPGEVGGLGGLGDGGGSGGVEPEGSLSWPTRVAVARLVAYRSPALPLDAARELTAAVRARADPAERDLVDAALADTLGYRGQAAEAGDLARRLLRSPNPAARAMALGPAVVWLVSTGRAEEAVTAGRAVLTDLLARPRIGGVPVTPTQVVSSLGTALLAAGRLDDVEELCATAELLPIDQPGRSEGTVALFRGLTALLRGQPATAREALGLAVLGFERAGTVGHHAFALISLAEAKALLGETELALQTWDLLPQAQRDHPPLDWCRSQTWIELVRHQDAKRAARQAVATADVAQAAGTSFFELVLAYTAVQMGAVDQAPRVAALAAGMQGPLAEAVGAHTEALARGDGTGLEHAAERFEQLGFRLFAAEAAVHAALAHRRAGSASRARLASTRAAQLRARCEGARTPTLAQAAMVADLTEREREIALLAAQSLTSRQIAERLGISVRTVDNQLGRVYTKLEVTGRRDLAAAVEQMDGDD